MDGPESANRATEPVIPEEEEENVLAGFAKSSIDSKLSAVSLMMAIWMASL